jgi:2',3'-cyclic-nucleotide 2'-phosphodiesterase (5'-nucleotidase family)
MAVRSLLAGLLFVLVVSAQPGIGPIDQTPSPSSFILPPKAPTPAPAPPPTQFAPAPSQPEPPVPSVLHFVHSSDSQLSPLSVAWVAKWSALVTAFTGSVPESSFFVSGGNNWRSGPGYDAGSTSTNAIRTAWNNQFLQGGPGRADLTIQTLVGLTASALGPHEFDATPAGLQSLIQANSPDWLGAQFPFLAANLDFSQASELSGLYTSSILPTDQFITTPTGANYKLSASAYIRNNDGFLYGFVGLSPGDIRYDSQSDSVWSTNSVNPNRASTIAGIVQSKVDALRAMYIKKIILLANVGSVALAKALAPLLSGVDVIVAGGVLNSEEPANVMVNNPLNLFPGDNQAEAYPYQTTDVDGNPIVVVYTKGLYEYVGKLVINFDKDGIITSAAGDVWPATDDAITRTGASKNTATYANVENIAKSVGNYFSGLDSQVVAKFMLYVDGAESGNTETTMGDLMADSFVWFLAKNKITADLGVVPASAITGNFGFLGNPPYQNKITKLAVALAAKDNYNLVVVNVTAAGLKSEFENAIYGYLLGQRESFLQVSHVSVLYNTYASLGDRVRNLAILNNAGGVQDQIVKNGVFYGDPARAIRVATNVFLADGHNGFTFPISSIGRQDTAFATQDAFQAYLTNYFLESPYTNVVPAGHIQVEYDRTPQRSSAMDFASAANGKENTEILS